MRLRRMDIVNADHLRMLAPGVSCQGTPCVTVQETDHVISFSIAPEADSTTNLFVILPDNMTEKKYSIDVNFLHANATINIFGLYQMRNKQSVEIKTTINHLVSHCTSKQIWKGVLHDFAKATFEGKINVASRAQKTAAHLSNKNLLLSKNAEINTKPILEIYADDVICSHGATVGFLDQEALFYLRSRGIEENAARQLLIDAFADEILNLV